MIKCVIVLFPIFCTVIIIISIIILTAKVINIFLLFLLTQCVTRFF